MYERTPAPACEEDMPMVPGESAIAERQHLGELALAHVFLNDPGAVGPLVHCISNGYPFVRPQDREDIIQEVAVRILQRPSYVEPGGSRDEGRPRCRPISRIARSLILDKYTPKAGRVKYETYADLTATDDWGSLADSAETPEGSYERTVQRTVVKDILDELTETDQMILRLHYFEGMPLREVHAAINYQHGMAKLKAHVREIRRRAFQLLRARGFNSYSDIAPD